MIESARTITGMPKRLPRIPVCMLALLLCACSSGGGGSSPSMGVPPASSTPIVVIGAPADPIIASTPESFPAAAGTTPNSTTSFPANGTSFPLLQTGFDATSSVVNGQQTNSVTGLAEQQGVTLTITGTHTVNGETKAILEMKIPGRNVDATGLAGDGSNVTLADGRSLALTVAALNYSLYGFWALSPAVPGSTGNSELGIGISGYQTPPTGVPTGTATYVGNGTTAGAVGVAVTGTGSGTVAGGVIQGQANIGVNFSTGMVSGSLTNMMITPVTTVGSLATSGSAVPWNNVSLTGSLSGSNLSGTAASSGTPPSGSMSFGVNSTGTFNGALFGPNGQELGAVWTLHDATSPGKSAIGFVSGVKQ